MDLPLSLTIEQELQMRIFTGELDKLSEAEAKTMLLEVIRQNMIKGNLVKYFMKKEMGAPCC